MTDYSIRFVRLAARYEEDFLGDTSIGHPTAPFEFPTAEYTHGRLGSGIVFTDEAAGSRELLGNASRIEGWRHTKSYEYFKNVGVLLLVINVVHLVILTVIYYFCFFF